MDWQCFFVPKILEKRDNVFSKSVYHIKQLKLKTETETVDTCVFCKRHVDNFGIRGSACDFIITQGQLTILNFCKTCISWRHLIQKLQRHVSTKQKKLQTVTNIMTPGGDKVICPPPKSGFLRKHIGDVIIWV